MLGKIYCAVAFNPVWHWWDSPVDGAAMSLNVVQALDFKQGVNIYASFVLDKALETFGPRIHIEAGASIFQDLISAGRIDQLELSITEITGGEDKLDIEQLLSSFAITNDQTVEGTRFISAVKK